MLRRGDATYRFFLGDCVQILPHLTSASVQTIVTSPPYNLGIAYSTYEDRLPRSSYLAWSARWRGAGTGLRCRGNTWFLPYETIQYRNEERPHPATFPVRLPEYCLRLHGLGRIGQAADPFLGLGHTAVACARLG